MVAGVVFVGSKECADTPETKRKHVIIAEIKATFMDRSLLHTKIILLPLLSSVFPSIMHTRHVKFSYLIYELTTHSAQIVSIPALQRIDIYLLAKQFQAPME
ncbi:hypothetical protein D3C78_1562030 [compost metagenome]